MSAASGRSSIRQHAAIQDRDPLPPPDQVRDQLLERRAENEAAQLANDHIAKERTEASEARNDCGIYVYAVPHYLRYPFEASRLEPARFPARKGPRGQGRLCQHKARCPQQEVAAGIRTVSPVLLG
ncbi:MAG TPA: hypothetical protein VFQ44_21990 [Streptosporangiaceae bacterium]|nr:hypothetical protein [Streptosporangiaceae bacterium]